MSKKTSVVMAVYNGRYFLREQLNSIINQSLRIDELVIIDDCSSERSDDIINNCLVNSNIELKYIVHKENKGYAQSFFEAIKSATGDCIFLSDQDDIWEGNKVELCTQIMLEHPEISCLSSLNILIDSTGKEIKREQKPNQYLYQVTCEEVIKQTKLRPGMTLAINRDLANKVTKLDTRDYRQHDRLIEYMSAIDKGFYILCVFLNKYRIHDNNTSGLNLSHYRLRSDINGRIEQIDKEIQYLELIEPIEKDYKTIIEQCIEYNNLRRKLLSDRKLFQYLLCIPSILNYSRNYRICAGDVLSIIKTRDRTK